MSTTTNPSASTSSTSSTFKTLMYRGIDLKATNYSSVSKEPTPTPRITLSKLSDNSLSRFHHQIPVIVHEFSIDSPIDKLLFKTNIECVQYLTENFTYLDGTNENIFACNAHNSTFNVLLMNTKSIDRLLNLKGAIG